MDAQSAINEILSRNATGNPMSVAELRTLASSVDASVGSSTLLLYSGGVGDLKNFCFARRKTGTPYN